MAGRGCSITVYVNPGSTVTSTIVFGERTNVFHIQHHDNGMVGWVLPLFVALHTPLEVLREQLQQQTGFDPKSQVLILCDLSDKDRNNDNLLGNELDHCSLFECGIREGSILSLHPIGSCENKTDEKDDNEELQSAQIEEIETFTLSTPITAAEADHSYNGVIFDVESRGPYEVEVVSLSVGGMLGRVRIFTRDGSYEDFETEPDPSGGRWWAHHAGISPDGWNLVVDKVVKASWDTPTELTFDRKVTVLPRQRRAFYIHSGLPDDLGIQYQSYAEDDVVAESEHILLLPGLGHTGSDPFDEVNGWYRAYRGLAGNIRYKAKRKGWNIWEHSYFPEPLRRAVYTMLLLNARASNMVLEHRLNNMHNDRVNSSKRRAITDSSYYHQPTSDYMPLDAFDMQAMEGIPPGVLLMSLPQYVVYYIMEFMHWDWFEELYSVRERGSRLLDIDDEGVDDDEYEQFRSHRNNGRWGDRRGRSRHDRNRGSYARSQQTVARMLTHMFMQQDSDEEGSDEQQELVMDTNMLHVMNNMLGGGLSHIIGALQGGDNSWDDCAESDEDDDDEEEESKDDVYLSVNNDGSSGTWTAPAVQQDIDLGGHDYVDSHNDEFEDDDDDEEYARLNSRY